jgi:hypothetical protein
LSDELLERSARQVVGRRRELELVVAIGEYAEKTRVWNYLVFI